MKPAFGNHLNDLVLRAAAEAMAIIKANLVERLLVVGFNHLRVGHFRFLLRRPRCR